MRKVLPFILAFSILCSLTATARADDANVKTTNAAELKEEAVESTEITQPDSFNDITEEVVIEEETARDETEPTTEDVVPETSESVVEETASNMVAEEIAVTSENNDSEPITLEEFLVRASTEGFLYKFNGESQDFDGSRIVSGTDEDISKLKASSEGTLIVRYQTENSTNQVLFAAGNNTSENGYGAILANNVSNVGLQRIDFPNGMYANLSDTNISSDWHTFVYSVDATDLSSTTGKTVTSFDGSTTTQYPNFASWYNANTTINDIQYLTIGGVSGTLENSSNNQNFAGKIAFVAFVPEAVSQSDAAVLSGTIPDSDNETTGLVYSAQNLSIEKSSDVVAFSSDILSTLSELEEATIIVQYQNTGSGIGSLFSISNTSTYNSHFHVYQYGNTIGYEFRNSDSPKYAASGGGVLSGELNTIAFKAEKNVGYKLFANGVLGSTLSKDSSSYQFLADLTFQNAGYIGKTERSNDPDSYLYSGSITWIEIYNTALSDDYLISVTSETEIEIDDNRVFYNGDETSSKFFRIPFLLSTSNGTLIAGADANFGSTGDSAENIDCAIRRKSNASSYEYMEGWSNAVVPTVLHMMDYTDSVGYRQQSASYIDGVIFEDEKYTDRVYIVIDAFPWNGGVFSYLNINSAGEAKGGTNRNVAYGDGFCTIDGQKYLLLSSQNITGSDSHGTNNINQNVTRSNFDYVADVYGDTNSDGRYNIYNLIGTPKEYSSTGTTVDDSNLSLGTLSEYSLSADYELYKNGVLQTIYQRSDDTTYTTTQVPMKIFYKDSLLQMYNTSYLMQFYSTDDGATWHTANILNGMVKPENSRYFVTGPGQGIQLKNGAHAGRILVPIYCQMSGVSNIGNPATRVIYSDDGGVTWDTGAVIPSALGLHESALVEMPDGSVKIFVRNTSSSGGKYITATSNDGGETWHDVESVFGDSSAGINCQISAIGLSTRIADPDDPTQTYPALVMTTAYNKARTYGKMYVGLIKEDGTYSNGDSKYTIDWAYEYDVTSSTALFAYSCMTELENGNVGLLYETSPDSTWSTGLQAIYYKEYTVAELIS